MRKRENWSLNLSCRFPEINLKSSALETSVLNPKLSGWSKLMFLNLYYNSCHFQVNVPKKQVGEESLWSKKKIDFQTKVVKKVGKVTTNLPKRKKERNKQTNNHYDELCILNICNTNAWAPTFEKDMLLKLKHTLIHTQ